MHCPETIAMAQKGSAKEAGRRKKLSEKIELLGSIEHGEIFRKLKMCNLGYTQNSNGIFFDITDVPGDVIDDLVSFVDHCIENQKMLKTSRRNQFLRSSQEGKTPAADFDGDDNLDDDSNALDELNLKHTVRVDDVVHSIYKADFAGQLTIAESKSLKG